MIADFHRRGVRVLFPDDDVGPGDPRSRQALAGGNCGIHEGDGRRRHQRRHAGRCAAGVFSGQRIAGHPLAFEPEGAPADEAIAWNTMTWGQYKFTFAPQVDRFKWLEPRHMVNISHRWNRNKTDDIQFAFFNGIGWESWENIWGIWNGITPRDGEATRRMATIERGVAPFLVSKDGSHFFPMLLYGVFASRWPLGDQTVWTIVNRNEYDVSGPQISVPAMGGERYFDLYHGTELKPDRDGDAAALSFDIEAHGYRRSAGDKGRTEPGDSAVDVSDAVDDRDSPHQLFEEWTSIPQH